MSFLIKRVLKMLTGNQALQVQLFFWLAKQIVERTDNEFDDELLEMIKDQFGEIEDLE